MCVFTVCGLCGCTGRGPLPWSCNCGSSSGCPTALGNRSAMDGQSCLVALQPEIEAGMSKAMTTYVSDVGSFALAADLCALEHETAEQRIYRT